MARVVYRTGCRMARSVTQPRVCAPGAMFIAEAGKLADTGRAGQTLLIRRNTTTGELAFYRCWTPAQVGLAALHIPGREGIS